MYLTLHSVSAGYGTRMVLRNLSLRAEAGEVLGLIGANGAGKSTLIRVISGTLAPRSGHVCLTRLTPLPQPPLPSPDEIHRERGEGATGVRGEAIDLTHLNARQRAQRVAVVPQGVRLPEAFSVMEVVLMGRTPYLPLLGSESQADMRIAREAMEQTDILQLAERRMGELSGGEQQRVLVARALAQQPQVMLLDEATAHLDLKHQSDVLRLVRSWARAETSERGLIVIAAMHDLNLAALYADRLALLCHGELLAVDKPAAVLTPELLQRAYDVSVTVGQHPIHHTPLIALVENGRHT